VRRERRSRQARGQRGVDAARERLNGSVRELAARLIDIPAVVAVTPGGAPAGGRGRADGERGLWLYYRGELRADDLRALGFEGTVGEPGEWGRPANGGARLAVGGQRVDLFYRDLDAVGRWLERAEAGSYEVDRVEGYLAGMASYVLVGELAWPRCWRARCPDPSFPTRSAGWRRHAGGAAPPPRWRSPMGRRSATTSSPAPGRPARRHRAAQTEARPARSAR
jgi:hypothetical protein